ncbi:MAG: putative baseplate assembly protein [Caldilineaceae bacterium]
MRRPSSPNRRGADFARNYLSRLAVQDVRVFREGEPVEGDTFYLGFDQARPVNGYIIQLQVASLPTQGTGVRRDDPPLVWECSLGDGKWFEVQPSQLRGETDTTGGLNNPNGQMVFYLPLRMRPDEIQGVSAYWLRCRFEKRRASQGTYSRSPRIAGIAAFALGSTVTATHATLVRNEDLGVTNGEPGARFTLLNAPLLDPGEGEMLEIEERVEGSVACEPWTRVEDFSRSTRYDRHYTLNTATGEIQLGPSIRQSDGQMQQYGRVPDAGRRVRFTQYRAGGGLRGNLPPNRITVMRSTVPYIDSVTNLIRAEGGRDAETLDQAKIRVPQELRTQQRAVTAEDFQDLALKSGRNVARVHCLTPGKSPKSPAPGTVELLVVPSAFESLQAGELSGLYVSEALARQVDVFLDKYRLLTTTLLVREPAYVGVQVRANVVADDFLPAETLRTRINRALRCFLSPLPLENPDDPAGEWMPEDWGGWPFGRSLYLSDIHALIQNVAGVRHVQDLMVSSRQVTPVRELSLTEQIERAQSDPPLLTPVDRVLYLEQDALVCSLLHEVVIVDPRTPPPGTRTNGNLPSNVMRNP